MAREDWPRIAGWHDEWQESLLAWGEDARKQHPEAFAGFLNALYTFRSMMKPAAFQRSPEMEQFQQSLKQVISRLERHVGPVTKELERLREFHLEEG